MSPAQLLRPPDWAWTTQLVHPVSALAFFFFFASHDSVQRYRRLKLTAIIGWSTSILHLLAFLNNRLFFFLLRIKPGFPVEPALFIYAQVCAYNHVNVLCFCRAGIQLFGPIDELIVRYFLLMVQYSSHRYHKRQINNLRKMTHFGIFFYYIYVNHESLTDIILYVDILFIQSQKGLYKVFK